MFKFFLYISIPYEYIFMGGDFMRLLILNKKTLYLILIVLILVIVVPIMVLNRLKTENVFKEDIYYQGTKDEKTIAFACNIDWGNEHIGEMLEIFKKNNIKITFFPTGRWAEKNPELLQTIHSGGHEIGNHGYNHLDYDTLSFEKNYEEIEKAHISLKDIVGEAPKYFAPPSGAYNDYTIEAAQKLNYKVILWSIDTVDWRDDSVKDVIVKRIKDKIHNSAIILMHPTAETNKALPEIIDFLFEKGYKIGTISDVI